MFEESGRLQHPPGMKCKVGRGSDRLNAPTTTYHPQHERVKGLLYIVARAGMGPRGTVDTSAVYARPHQLYHNPSASNLEPQRLSRSCETVKGASTGLAHNNLEALQLGMCLFNTSNKACRRIGGQGQAPRDVREHMIHGAMQLPSQPEVPAASPSLISLPQRR